MLKKNCSRDFFIKIQTNSHVSQAGKLFCTQKFTNRNTCFAVFDFSQIRINLNFEELCSQNSFKNFIGKIKVLKVVYLNGKRRGLLLKSRFTKQIILSRTFPLFYS